MKNVKTILIIGLILSAFIAAAQEKGWYLTAAGSLGANNYRYTLDNKNHSIPQLGFGGNLGVQYFFSRHWGLATGVGISFYNSKGNYANSWDNDPQHYAFEGMYDDDFRYLFGDDYTHYTLRLGLSDWTEVQQGYFIEIPLMLMYQTKWGASQSWGMYFGVGAKAQIPVISQTYKVNTGSELSVSAYYETPDLVLPDPNGPDVSWHGYGVNDKITYDGDMEVKTSFALSGKIGFLKTLSPRVDLTLGAYLDYGLNNIKNGNKTEGAYLIGPENNAKTIHPSSYVGDHLQYNGYLNSHAVDKVNLLAIGGELGVRIRLGKLETEVVVIPEIIEPVKPEKYAYFVRVVDSLTLEPLATRVEMNCTDCPAGENGTFNSSKDSSITLRLRPAHTYPFRITKSGFPDYTTEVITSTVPGFANVPGNQNITLKVPLRPVIKGNVKNTKNNPLSGVEISLLPSGGIRSKLVTDNNGNFTTMPLDARTRYQIIAVKTGYDTARTEITIPVSAEELQPVYNVMLEMKPSKKIILSALVLFDFAKFDLRPEAKRDINNIVSMMKENPEITLTLDGHTDSRGSAAYNEKLSLQRANAVRDYMIEQGVSPQRIRAFGWGYRKPVNQCKPKVHCTEAEHQENRRVEFVFKDK